MRWLLLLVACVGCRQLLGLDPGTVAEDAPPMSIDTASEIDARTGHDEDLDGVPDTTDNCPTIPNPGQERATIGETVGLDCDPRLDLTGDQIAAFYSFSEDMRPAGLSGGNMFSNDQAMLSGGDISMQMELTPSRVSAILSRADFLSPSSFLELNLSAGSYSCRIGSCSGSGTRCLRASGDNAFDEVDVFLTPPLRFELEQLGGVVRCRVFSALAEVTTAAPIVIPRSGRPRLRVNGSNVTVDSFIIYSITP